MAAAGLSGGKFGRCRAAAVPLHHCRGDWGGQRRGEIGGGREEIGRTTDGLEVKKMIGRVRAG